MTLSSYHGSTVSMIVKYIDQVKTSWGTKAMHKAVIEHEGSYFIREGYIPYDAHIDGEMDPLKA